LTLKVHQSGCITQVLVEANRKQLGKTLDTHNRNKREARQWAELVAKQSMAVLTVLLTMILLCTLS